MARFLSRKEFSQEMGISLSTLNRRIKEGEWPFNASILIGSRRLYPATLLDKVEETVLLRKEAKNESLHE
jgi:hypothetical protein